MLDQALRIWTHLYFTQLGQCGSDDVLREVAKDLGLTPSQLRGFASKKTGAADQWQKMLCALDVDPKALADTEALIMRELQRVCITCSDKKRCKHELANGKAAEHFREFCPNALTLDTLWISPPAADNFALSTTNREVI